jgi:hypothetical protein
VTAAFYKKYPEAQGKVSQIEKATHGEGADQKITYEFQFAKGKDKYEVIFDSQGKFVSEEKVGK